MTARPPISRAPNAAFAYAQKHAESIRRLISRRIGPRIRRIVDTVDIEQSLLVCLLRRPDPPQVLNEEGQQRLITMIVLRKIWNKARKEHILLYTSLPDEADRASTTADPAETASNRELIEAARQAAGDDWLLIIAREEGRTFPELEGQFHASHDALRMRFNRALERITKVLAGPTDG